MSTDKREFEARCRELRDAKAAVDVYQRTSDKGGFETVTVHIHAEDDKSCIARFKLPVGAVNGILDTCVSGVETAERIASVLDKLKRGAALDRGARLSGGYRDGELA